MGFDLLNVPLFLCPSLKSVGHLQQVHLRTILTNVSEGLQYFCWRHSEVGTRLPGSQPVPLDLGCGIVDPRLHASRKPSAASSAREGRPIFLSLLLPCS